MVIFLLSLQMLALTATIFPRKRHVDDRLDDDPYWFNDLLRNRSELGLPLLPEDE